MSIFSRTRDIIAANVVDLVNRSDDPAKTIRVVILEMEETLVEVRASAARLIADQKEKRRQLHRLGGLQDEWTGRAELALNKGRDDLARAALMEKEKLAGLAEELGQEIEAIETELKASEGDIAKLQAKLREARSRQNAVSTRLEGAQNRARMREVYAGSRAEEAFAQFETLEREADYAEGQAEALALAAPKSLEEEIAELKVAERVDAELAAMKANLNDAALLRSRERRPALVAAA
jgi:phage shock protein A